MTKCYLCDEEIDPGNLKTHRAKSWHIKCLRKLRRKAKKKFSGNLDVAFRKLKEGKKDGQTNS